VDETLRYDPSVPAWRRVTTRPVTLGGVDLPEGAKLFLWLAAAGRDLGKLEAQLALEQLTRRYPDLLLVADQELTFHPNISFRGPQQLWVTTSRDLTRDG
jgi:cytochrome P450